MSKHLSSPPPKGRRRRASRYTAPHAGGGRLGTGQVLLRAAAALGTSALVLALVLLTGSTGVQALIVRSGSMAPAIAAGDAILVRPVAVDGVEPGTVVTFRSPEDPDHLLTHRVVEAELAGGEVSFVTKGDANSGVESWSAVRDGRVGALVLRLPYAGYLLHWLTLPVVPLVLSLLGVGVLLHAALVPAAAARPSRTGRRSLEVGRRTRGRPRAEVPAGAHAAARVGV